MKKNYLVLDKQVFNLGKYSLMPIRAIDRYLIMKWRNEQIYHLRQNDFLNCKKQDDYFTKVLSKHFEENQPLQILFSYLYNDKCIGYGGLVHIDWLDRNSELSFIMETELELLEFELHWSNFLTLIERVAFGELNFKKIYTYAFDLRPKLFPILEKNNFRAEARLRSHKFIENKFVDVLIHSKINEKFTI